MRGWCRSFGVLVVAAVSLAASEHPSLTVVPRQTGARSGAALPRLVLDQLPPHVRETIETAYSAAADRPREVAAVGRLAMLLHAYEQFAAASACYRIARGIDPESLDWPYLGAIVEAELGAEAAAANALRDVVRRNPDHLPARLRLADLLLRAGDLQESRNQYAALARDYPELALAHYGLGRLATVAGDPGAAAPHYEKALSLAPAFGPAHYALAIAYRDAGVADRAQPHLAAYRRFGTRRPAIPDPLMDRVRTLRETARDLLAEAASLADAGQLDASIALHLKALTLDPATAQAHVNLIALYGRRHDPGKAREHYEAALGLDGSVADAHYNYGVVLISEGRAAEAASAFRRALGVNPFHPAAHNNLASLLARRGMYEEARAHYQQALANDPQHPTARLNLGRVLARLGRHEEALSVLRQALERAEQRGDTKLSAVLEAELLAITAKR